MTNLQLLQQFSIVTGIRDQRTEMVVAGFDGKPLEVTTYRSTDSGRLTLDQLDFVKSHLFGGKRLLGYNEVMRTNEQHLPNVLELRNHVDGWIPREE
jgi:hypothetical protein